MSSKIPIPAEVADHLKCSLCKNYLSVPPIMIITDDGGQQKCGRCVKIQSKLNLRNHSYEKMAELHSFPCMYSKCTTRIPWGGVKDHEAQCPNRTLKCIVHSCNDTIEVSDYKTHCTSKHFNITYSNRLVYEGIEFDCHYLGIIIKNDLPFFVYINVEPEDFWVSVFTAHPHLTKNWRYNVRLSSGNTGDPFLLYENQVIVPYDEREHCVKCLDFDCRLKYHPYSKLYKTVAPRVKTTVISPQRATFTLDTNKFFFAVTIVNDVNSNILKSVLQCPVCLENMEGPIFACSKGHAICKMCKPKVEACPTCRSSIRDTRLFSLEEIAKNFEVHCQYESCGCSFMGSTQNVAQHEEECPFGLGYC